MPFSSVCPAAYCTYQGWSHLFMTSNDSTPKTLASSIYIGSVSFVLYSFFCSNSTKYFCRFIFLPSIPYVQHTKYVALVRYMIMRLTVTNFSTELLCFVLIFLCLERFSSHIEFKKRKKKRATEIGGRNNEHREDVKKTVENKTIGKKGEENNINEPASAVAMAMAMAERQHR